MLTEGCYAFVVSALENNGWSWGTYSLHFVMAAFVCLHVEIRRLLKVGNVSVGMPTSHETIEIVGVEIEPQKVKVLVQNGDSNEVTTHEFELEMCEFEPASGSALRHRRNDFNVRLRLSALKDAQNTSPIVRGVSCAVCEHAFLKPDLKLRSGINLSAIEMDALLGNTEFFCHAHGHGGDSNAEWNDFEPSQPNFEPGVSEFIEDTKRLLVRWENVDREALVSRLGRLFCARCGNFVAEERQKTTVEFDAVKVAIFQDGDVVPRQRTLATNWLLNEVAFGKKLCISPESGGKEYLLLQMMDGDLLVIDEKIRVDKGKNARVKVGPKRCIKLLYKLLIKSEKEDDGNPWEMDRYVTSVQLETDLFKQLLETLVKSTSGLHVHHLKSVDGFLVAYVNKYDSNKL